MLQNNSSCMMSCICCLIFAAIIDNNYFLITEFSYLENHVCDARAFIVGWQNNVNILSHNDHLLTQLLKLYELLCCNKRRRAHCSLWLAIPVDFPHNYSVTSK